LAVSEAETTVLRSKCAQVHKCHVFQCRLKQHGVMLDNLRAFSCADASKSGMVSFGFASKYRGLGVADNTGEG
jgi:hypothetical protein